MPQRDLQAAPAVRAMTSTASVCNAMFQHRRRSAAGMSWSRARAGLAAHVQRIRGGVRALPARRRVDPFDALADPTRRAILDILREDGVRTAGEIAEAFPRISRPAVSRHLRVMRESSILVAEQAGREWRYRIDATALAMHYRDFFERFAPMWEDALARLKRQVEGDTNGG